MKQSKCVTEKAASGQNARFPLQNLTIMAVKAQQGGTLRDEFLSGISPEQRGFAAMQYDRACALEGMRPPTEDEIMKEARNGAIRKRAIDWCEKHSQYGWRLFTYVFPPEGAKELPVSETMVLQAAYLKGYCRRVSDNEILAARAFAIEDLSQERNFLLARLGLSWEEFQSCVSIES